MMVTERSLNTASCSLALVMMCMAVWHMQNPSHFGRRAALAQVKTRGIQKQGMYMLVETLSRAQRADVLL